MVPLKSKLPACNWLFFLFLMVVRENRRAPGHPEADRDRQLLLLLAGLWTAMAVLQASTS